MINTNFIDEVDMQTPQDIDTAITAKIEAFYEALGIPPRKRNPNPYLTLSEQDCLVFGLYGQGFAIKEIAWQMSKPDHFVRNALERIKAKLGLFSKTELALHYHRQKKYKKDFCK